MNNINLIFTDSNTEAGLVWNPGKFEIESAVSVKEGEKENTSELKPKWMSAGSTLSTSDDIFWTSDLSSSTKDLELLEQIENLKSKIRRILSAPYPESEEYSSDELRALAIRSQIEISSVIGIKAIQDLFEIGEIQESLMAEILIEIGNIEDSWCLNGLVNIYSDLLSSPLPKIRYGAILGISNLDNPNMLKKLEQSYQNESQNYMLNYYRTTIEQLKESQTN